MLFRVLSNAILFTNSCNLSCTYEAKKNVPAHLNIWIDSF